MSSGSPVTDCPSGPSAHPSLDLRTSKGNKLAMSRASDVWHAGGRRHISIKAAKDAPRIHGLNLNQPTNPRPLERQQKSHPSPFLSTAPSKFVVSSLTAPPSHSLPHPSSIHSTPLFSSPLPRSLALNLAPFLAAAAGLLVVVGVAAARGICN